MKDYGKLLIYTEGILSGILYEVALEMFIQLIKGSIVYKVKAKIIIYFRKPVDAINLSLHCCHIDRSKYQESSIS